MKTMSDKQTTGNMKTIQMKKIIIVSGFLVLILLGGFYAKKQFYDPKHRLENVKDEVADFVINTKIKDGDLIFQTSLSQQSKAIQLATKSKYSHCGIIYK